MFAAFLVSILILAGPPPQEGQHEVVPGHVQIKPQFAHVKVAFMVPGTSGWIRHEDVVIDEAAYCWIKADAKVRSDDASATGIQVHRRKDGGYGLVVAGRPDWELQNKSNFVPGALLPCTSWKVIPVQLEAPPEMPKKKKPPEVL